MRNDRVTTELARHREALAHFQAELELLASKPMLPLRLEAEGAPSAARRLRRAIASTETKIRRLEARMPASDEI